MVVTAMWVAGTLLLVTAAALAHVVFGVAAAGVALCVWGWLLTEDGDG